MRRLFRLLVLGPLFFATPTLAAAPTYLWSRTAGAGGTEFGYAVAVDITGNVFVAGSFGSTVNFGGADLTSAGGNDIFIAKYTPTGEHVWSKRFGDVSTDEAQGIAVDATGNVSITGSFGGTVDFGSGTGLISAGGSDIFVARYSPAGGAVFSKRFGSTASDEGVSVAVDASSNVIVTGYFNGTVDFGSGVGLVSAGSSDVFVAKYSAFGTHQWSKSFGSTGADEAASVTTDASSNVIVTGAFLNTVNFGGANLVSAGANDVFLAKYNSGGTHQWSQRFGSTLNDDAHSVAVDASSSVVITGDFAGTVNFGGSSLVSAGFSDIFLAKYNSSGVHQWSKRFGDTGGETGYGVATDAAGSVIMTGSFQGSVDFGGGALAGLGGVDIFLAKYNAAGAHQYSRRAGGTSTDEGRGVAVDNDGDAIIIGRFVNTINFGGGIELGNGSTDVCVAKYSPGAAEPDITAIGDIGNDQGRRVQIKFTASGGDNGDAATPITSYEAYRKQKAPPAAASGGSRPQLLTGWTFVGSVPAHDESDYTIEAPTIGDTSILLGTYNSVFFIRAASDGNLFYDSLPDSGASVDNLSPGIPGSFLYTAGNLTWNESKDEDFDYFTVYGSRRAIFDATAVLINYTTATNMNVGGPYTFYYLTATDFNGNEGKPAIVTTLSNAGGTPQSYVLSVSNYPNPFNPRTTVNYTIPSRGHVSIRVFDAHGGLVATLFDGERNAGAYSVDWDGRAAGASFAASGVYFARIEHNGSVRTKKMVLLK